MDVPVASVAEGSDRKTMSRLQLTCELDQINQAAAWDNDVLIQFR
jgi:hypothetical protein